MSAHQPSAGRPRRRLLRRRRFRIASHSGAEVVSLRQLPAKERLRVTAPSIFTAANMACGFSAVPLAFNDHSHWAAILMTVAIFMDVADGAVARLVGATSPFGVQLDSLADLISFGLAPAVLVYTWVLPEWPVIAWVAAYFWLACAAFRLARFNFTIDPHADKRYFIGMPSPGAAAVVIATVFALDLREDSVGPSLLLPVVISVVPALLMVSTVRFRSFRNLVSPQTQQARVVTGVIVVAFLAGLAFVPAATMLVVAYSYVLTAPFGVITAPLRRRIFGPDSVAPPRVKQQSVFLPLHDDSDTDPDVDSDVDSDVDDDCQPL
ncbi:CDP-diacylglycerol--serine O-phosphatidyltransferase [Nocardioides marmoriginsengisoli]|uniref:CDP-diacylglycerol--serine O-phosphatidyltransferase n=1 Tax=Nocardioides marmoriginsengisoli TaxID=661483 RepID=A0A3N0C915_9ACTN|nr:CDP-diacylglycerol--serine O-phosphatidyltransferase [Nocardioides marmoriginsengisoli]RNL59958.1 CDP-diacylglycerol--serine O-phosphatidyltransferase [Nocardioides marmoriginsengisoli]